MLWQAHSLPRKIWLRAYLAVSAWYAANLGIGSFVTYYFFSPQSEEVWYGVYLFLFYVVYVAMVWLWATWLWRFPISGQVLGQLLGCLMGFLTVSWVNFQLSIYADNRIADTFDMYLLTSYSGTKVSGRLDAFRLYTEYVALVFIIYALRYAFSLKKREQEKARLLVENKEMELSLLKSQINPHFLFNTLNSISMLVGVSKSKARMVISQLSDVLRYTLELGQQTTIKLSEEITLTESFLRIQQVRFDGVFEYEFSIPEEFYDYQLPPMVLQPLVENAIKHGVGKRSSGGRIEISAQEKNGGILLLVADNGSGTNKKSPPLSPSTGIGLHNTDQRLQHLFGKESALEVQPSEKVFSVGFFIPKPRP